MNAVLSLLLNVSVVFPYCTLINNAAVKPFIGHLTVSLNILLGRIPRRETTGRVDEFFPFQTPKTLEGSG